MVNFLVNMMRTSEFDETGKVCSILQTVDDRNEPKLPKFRCFGSFGSFRFGEIQIYRNETPSYKYSCIQIDTLIFNSKWNILGI